MLMQSGRSDTACYTVHRCTNTQFHARIDACIGGIARTALHVKQVDSRDANNNEICANTHEPVSVREKKNEKEKYDLTLTASS